MKILALNGSHRGEAGCTQLLLDKLAQGAGEAGAAGADFETVVLAKQNIMPCSGCEVCHTPEHYLRCVHEDDVQAIFSRMKTADLVIYATPVYIFNISGLMKTFMDRFNSTAGTGEIGLTQSGLFFGKVDRDICAKPFVVLTCCGNIEDETVQTVVSYFKTFARFMDAPLVGTLVRRSVGMLSPGTEPETERQKTIITEVVDAYVQAGRELATLGRITAGTEKRANQNLMGIPFLDLLMKFRFFKRMALSKAKSTTS